MDQTKAQSNGVRVIQLVETLLPQIMRRERKNTTHISLYEAGEYWMAFEYSAYLLCGLFPNLRITVIEMHNNPFPIVMAGISDEELRRYASRHILKRDYLDYKEIVPTKTPATEYHQWHQQACSHSYLQSIRSVGPDSGKDMLNTEL